MKKTEGSLLRIPIHILTIKSMHVYKWDHYYNVNKYMHCMSV